MLFVRSGRVLRLFFNGLVGRWRESLGGRQTCPVSIQRAGKGAAARLGVLPWRGAEPEQSHCGHLAIPSVGSGGFGGLLANSNLFQRIRTWGNACASSRSFGTVTCGV